MEVIAAGFIAAAAALLSSWLTARHMWGVTDRQIEAARDTERTHYLRDIRRDRVEEVRGLLIELQATLAAISEYVSYRVIAKGFGISSEQALRIGGIDSEPHRDLANRSCRLG